MKLKIIIWKGHPVIVEGATRSECLDKAKEEIERTPFRFIQLEFVGEEK